ncbi:hypothetical protein Plhal304r1_c048g0130011 [Plasmopara halstedii]
MELGESLWRFLSKTTAADLPNPASTLSNARITPIPVSSLATQTELSMRIRLVEAFLLGIICEGETLQWFFNFVQRFKDRISAIKCNAHPDEEFVTGSEPYFDVHAHYTFGIW